MPEQASPNKADSIFRAYDIRGVFNEDLTVELAANVGLVFGSYVGAGKKVCLGRDTRTSSEALENAIASGLVVAGCHVTCVGVKFGTAISPFWNTSS